MPFVFLYLLKLSISLTVVFLFYQLVLQRLTFYNWNRIYLLGYIVISFFIPFINLGTDVKNEYAGAAQLMEWIPVLYSDTTAFSEVTSNESTIWKVAAFIAIAGAAVMLIRLFIQLLSFQKIKRRATLISDDSITIYHVDEQIIPFSFGNAVFINSNLHSSKELEEIILHEFIHVRQRHTIDVMMAEFVCLVNWFNPFAWMLRNAIRQNLEFVADDKVLQNGINKKEYQYLLLKVIGNKQFSIAMQFNFSSLKKRIAMMNKIKTAKVQVLRFLFILPVLAIILVSFRKEIGDTLRKPTPTSVASAMKEVKDTLPLSNRSNDKGYHFNIWEDDGSSLIIITDGNGKEVKRMSKSEWKKDETKWEAIYGQLPTPPAPPMPPPPPMSIAPLSPLPPLPPFTSGKMAPLPPLPPVEPPAAIPAVPPLPPLPPVAPVKNDTNDKVTSEFMNRNNSIRQIGWVYDHDNKPVIAFVFKKKGNREV